MDHTAHAFRPGIRTLAVILCLFITAAPGTAQQPEPVSDSIQPDPEHFAPRMVLGGIAGGLAGLAAGAAIGAVLERQLTSNCIDYCGLGGGVIGGVVGESLGMAYGVHTGNGRQGSYAAAVVGPIAVLTGSIMLAQVLPGGDIPAAFIVIGVPVGQLAASIGGERAAARRKARAP